MSKPNLAVRSRQAELMDAPDVDPLDLEHAMRHLEIVNRWLNGYGPTLAGIRKLLLPGTQEFSLLDVGCGSGDTLRQIARWARRRRIAARLTGIELSAQSAQRAAEACRDYPEIAVRHQDIFGMTDDEPYDITHCALVLHHFADDNDVVAVLRKMAQMARFGIVINDLHRHPLAYDSIRALTRLLSRSHILQNDAPLSVARAFTREELRDFAARAGLIEIGIEWHWAFRWLLTGTLDGYQETSRGEPV